MIIRILRWLLAGAGFSLYTSTTPKGVRIGGTDIVVEPDRYIILEITHRGATVFVGYWQTS